MPAHRTHLSLHRRSAHAILAATLLSFAPSTAARADGTTSGRARGYAATDYPLFDYDAMRSGRNPHEIRISPASVGRLSRLWSVSLGGVADSSPIELTNIQRGGRRLDLLYLTGKNGTTYALDATTGARVWTFNATHGERLRDYQITTSSPAADPTRAWIYSASPDGTVHKLSAATGGEAYGWPVTVTLHAQDEKISSALNVSNTTLLVTTSGYVGDFGHYQGHVAAIDTGSRAVRVFNTLCSDRPALLAESPGPANYCPDALSGVWARAGTVVDTMQGSPTAGQIFIATGNGVFDGRIRWGDSVLRLAADPGKLQLRDSYTPGVQNDLYQSDADLGSSTPILLPRQPGARPWLALQGGKDNRLRLLDRANLSGANATGHLGGELASIPMPLGGDMLTTGITWQDSHGVTWIAVGDGQGLATLRLSTAAGRPQLRTAWSIGGTATSPLLANGVLFVSGDNAVRAVDAATGRILWTGSIGGIHWQSPLVANGRVVVADMDGRVSAFGLP